MSEQNFSSHTRFVPVFHFFVLPVLVFFLIHTIHRVYWAFAYHSDLIGFSTVFGMVGDLLLAIAVLLLAILTRNFALGVQDRVIRLEERLRYEKLFPEDLKPRINEFTIDQVVALRFASEAELPALARKVLDEKITKRKAIKQMVRNWRPDYQRI